MQRRVDSREIRDRRRVLAEAFELLPPSVAQQTAKLQRGSDGSRILRGDRGQLFGQFHDHALAEFTLQAPGNLRAFMDYIEQLEADAFADRERRREAETRLDEVTNELLGAADLGINTREGLRRVQSAITSVRDRGRRRG